MGNHIIVYELNPAISIVLIHDLLADFVTVNSNLLVTIG